MGFLEATRFLTVLPLPLRQAPSETSVARSAVYFPLVGALLGTLLALADGGLRHYWSTQLAAAVVPVAWIALTGGLHLDGLADTADGLLGGGNRERRLAIMKDSRLGTFGALALFSTLLLKFALLAQLPAPWRASSLVLAPTLARWAMVQAIVRYPPARQEGMGRLFKQHTGNTSLGIASFVALSLSFLGFNLWGLAIFATALLVALLLNSLVTRALGGLTGDTHGALCEVEEVTVLATVVALTGVGLL